MNRKPIPFNRPYVSGSEVAYIRDALASSTHAGDGPFTKRCQDWIERYMSARKVLLTTSCTHALEMSAILLDLKQGDEVIIPSFTFVSTANAFVLRGAKPVFADIRPDTFNLDEEKLESLITSRTRAIVPVHYGGVGCEMDKLTEIADRHGLTIVEDNAHGMFGSYRGRPLGSFGAMSTQSFHETKNISCGEGGALIINSEQFTERAEIIREKGTNRTRFFRGQIDKYTWVDIGSSYLPADLLAAVLWAQLESSATIQARRKKIWGHYATQLRNWATDRNYQLPVVPEYCKPAWHLFYILFPCLATRQAFLIHMKNSGVMSVFHYLPLHLSEMGKRFGGSIGECPTAERVSDRIARLPLFTGMEECDLEQIVSAVRSFSG